MARSVYFALIYHGNKLGNISVWDVKDLSPDKAPGTAPLVSGHITQHARALPGSEASGPRGMAWVTSSHGPADKHVRGVHFQKAHHRTAPRVPSRPPSRPLRGRGQKHFAISHKKKIPSPVAQPFTVTHPAEVCQVSPNLPCKTKEPLSERSGRLPSELFGIEFAVE